MKKLQLKKHDDGSYGVYKLKSTGKYGLMSRFKNKDQAKFFIGGNDYDDLSDKKEVKKKTSKDSKGKSAGNNQ